MHCGTEDDISDSGGYFQPEISEDESHDVDDKQLSAGQLVLTYVSSYLNSLCRPSQKFNSEGGDHSRGQVGGRELVAIWN